jgi:hypothetical protein
MNEVLMTNTFFLKEFLPLMMCVRLCYILMTLTPRERNPFSCSRIPDLVAVKENFRSNPPDEIYSHIFPSIHIFAHAQPETE